MNEILTAGIQILAILINILVNDSRSPASAAAHAELIRVEQVMDARLKHLEDR